MQIFDSLVKKIKDKNARIGIVGLGYVGLPLAQAFAEKGFYVYGYDLDHNKISKLRKGIKYVTDVEPDEIMSLIKKNKFFPTTDAAVVSHCDAVIICVPTPLRKVTVPDISYVVAASKAVGKYVKRGQLIILESTSYPGTTREVLLPELKKGGLKEGRDFFLCFSPERVNPGDKKFPVTKIPKVVGGLTLDATTLAKLLYGTIIKNIFCVSSPEAAETCKLLENTFRLVNIALVNEFAMVCHKMKIDIWEVIAAAKTKPFGFMPFYPGPGAGGHCLAGKESLLVRTNNSQSMTTFKDLFEEKYSNGCPKHSINGVDYVRPSGLNVLSFDIAKQQPVFKEVGVLSRRKVSTALLKVVTNDNRVVYLTDKHPMLVESGRQFVIKWAGDLNPGDTLPFITHVPQIRGTEQQQETIDLVKALVGTKLIEKTRVRIDGESWQNYKQDISRLKISKEKIRDFIRENYLPLAHFLEAENKGFIKIRHKKLFLCFGIGNASRQIPAIFTIDNNFCRLVGYYLAKGCIAKDKSARVRFAFHREESETIADLLATLDGWKIKYSVCYPKQLKSAYVQVSSNIFAFLLRDILKCGKDSYTMRIPDVIFSQDKEKQRELLKGMFRGDAAVDVRLLERDQSKNGKNYSHQSNTAIVDYCSISDNLFQQLVHLLQAQDIIPAFKPGQNHLRIIGYDQLIKMKDIFLDSKKRKLEKFFSTHMKNEPNRSFERYKDFAVCSVKRVESAKTDYVYSMEVKDTNTFVTSYGIAVHNCLPCDPVYLSWKAKKFGFKTKMIDTAVYINHFMPDYVVRRVKELLGGLTGKKILVVGTTYKKDVRDLRESPAVEIIEKFKKDKVRVAYLDPMIPYLKIGGLDMKSIHLSAKNVKQYDCVVIATAHSGIDYPLIAENARLVFDTRNIFAKKQANIKTI